MPALALQAGLARVEPIAAVRFSSALAFLAMVWPAVDLAGAGPDLVPSALGLTALSRSSALARAWCRASPASSQPASACAPLDPTWIIISPGRMGLSQPSQTSELCTHFCSVLPTAISSRLRCSASVRSRMAACPADAGLYCS